MSREFSILKPGGWLQLVEIYPMIQSDNGTINDDSILRKVSKQILRSLEGLKDPRAPLRFDSMMKEAGLVERGNRMMQLPMNGWPASEYIVTLVLLFMSTFNSLVASPWLPVLKRDADSSVIVWARHIPPYFVNRKVPTAVLPMNRNSLFQYCRLATG
jgi:hypothetical protein